MDQDEDISDVASVSTAYSRTSRNPRRSQVLERDGMISGSETLSSDGRSWSPPSYPLRRTAAELIDAEYALVRIAPEGPEIVDLGDMVDDLDETVGEFLQVPSISPLNDGSLEVLVRNAHLPNLRRKVHESPVRLTLDSKYCPLEPLPEEVECWGLQAARELYALWFFQRATRVVRSSWAVAQMYYCHALERHRAIIRARLRGMIVIGIIKDSISDCLRMKRRDEEIRSMLMFIRRRLSKSRTGQSLRHSFQLGDVIQAESLATSVTRTSIAVD
ncbi:hypothetical protein H2204_001250 [Knufia peltigerae]|uniref:Uncharacterized protein n=1 Tax=Knufia peltigerae TaxID=1002370 RepID=A0AA39D3V9_9EURO|nr:hypothetical protein H2204_001250 [Knufia peltigerae]